MPFKKSNIKEDKKMLNDLLQRSAEARETHELFQKEYAFKRMIIEARKSENLTQKQLSEVTGLSQQAISRLETGLGSANLSTLLKYLNGLGYNLTISK